jgi:hypothetical protein
VNVAAAQIKKGQQKPQTALRRRNQLWPVKNPKGLFVTILSQVRQGTERSAAIYKELGELAHNSEIREARVLSCLSKP